MTLDKKDRNCLYRSVLGLDLALRKRAVRSLKEGMGCYDDWALGLQTVVTT